MSASLPSSGTYVASVNNEAAPIELDEWTTFLLNKLNSHTAYVETGPVDRRDPVLHCQCLVP